MVGVLHHYSNREPLVESLRKLAKLPQRKIPGQSTNPQAKLIHQPTSAEEASIIAEYLAGNTIRSIGESTDFHRQTIAAVLHRAEVPTRYHQRTSVDLDRAAELIASGMTVTETASALGIGRTTLVKARREAQST